MTEDVEQNAVSRDTEMEDLQFLRDAGLELLAKLKEIPNVAQRRRITEALLVFLDQQVKTTKH